MLFPDRSNKSLRIAIKKVQIAALSLFLSKTGFLQESHYLSGTQYQSCVRGEFLDTGRPGRHKSN